MKKTPAPRLAAAARGALRDAASGRGTPCAAGVANDASRFEAEAGTTYEAVLALALAHARVHVGRAQPRRDPEECGRRGRRARAATTACSHGTIPHASTRRHGLRALSPSAARKRTSVSRHVRARLALAACAARCYARAPCAVCGSPLSRRVWRTARLRSARALRGRRSRNTSSPTASHGVSNVASARCANRPRARPLMGHVHRARWRPPLPQTIARGVGRRRSRDRRRRDDETNRTSRWCARVSWYLNCRAGWLGVVGSGGASRVTWGGAELKSVHIWLHRAVHKRTTP